MPKAAATGCTRAHYPQQDMPKKGTAWRSARPTHTYAPCYSHCAVSSSFHNFPQKVGSPVLRQHFVMTHYCSVLAATDGRPPTRTLLGVQSFRHGHVTLLWIHAGYCDVRKRAAMFVGFHRGWGEQWWHQPGKMAQRFASRATLQIWRSVQLKQG